MGINHILNADEKDKFARYEIHRERGQMVGYDYFLWDTYNERPDALYCENGRIWYTDDFDAANRKCEELNHE